MLLLKYSRFAKCQTNRSYKRFQKLTFQLKDKFNCTILNHYITLSAGEGALFVTEVEFVDCSVNAAVFIDCSASTIAESLLKTSYSVLSSAELSPPVSQPEAKPSIDKDIGTPHVGVGFTMLFNFLTMLFYFLSPPNNSSPSFLLALSLLKNVFSFCLGRNFLPHLSLMKNSIHSKNLSWCFTKHQNKKLNSPAVTNFLFLLLDNSQDYLHWPK